MLVAAGRASVLLVRDVGAVPLLFAGAGHVSGW